MVLNLLTELRKTIARHARSLWPESEGVSFEVVPSAVKEHGDVATNVTLVLSKTLRKPPMELAEKLANEMHDDPSFERVEAARPGFVNFFLKSSYLTGQLDPFLQNLSRFPARKEKIVIEHTDVNPNKAMHIGHLRNAVLGDTINRVLERAGFATEVQYYVDDTGVQVADTFLGLRELKLQQKKGEKYDHYCWRVYAAINEAYEKQPELLEKRTLILHELENGTSGTARKVHEMAADILRDHLTSVHQFGIAYDLLVWESDILGFEFWKTAFSLLSRSDSFIKEIKGKNAGCWVLKTGEEAEDDAHSPDKVLVKSDGTVTYTGKDVAYHLWKFNLLGADFLYGSWKQKDLDGKLATTARKGKKSNAYGHADRAYNVIDVRQSYPQAMVKLALESLGHEKQASQLRHVSYGVVSLSQAAAQTLGEKTENASGSVSMSGRKGIGIKVDDLLASVEKAVRSSEHTVDSNRETEAIGSRAIAAGAIKYFMLRYNPNTDIAFDLDEALSLRGNTGVYLQYAHARAAGILEKAGSKTVEMPKAASDLSAEEQRLIRHLYWWPSVIESVSESLNVNDMCVYAFELANAFNAFYEANPVLKAEGAIREQRLAFVHAFKAVLGDVLGILGIAAPDKM